MTLDTSTNLQGGGEDSLNKLRNDVNVIDKNSDGQISRYEWQHHYEFKDVYGPWPLALEPSETAAKILDKYSKSAPADAVRRGKTGTVMSISCEAIVDVVGTELSDSLLYWAIHEKLEGMSEKGKDAPGAAFIEEFRKASDKAQRLSAILDPDGDGRISESDVARFLSFMAAADGRQGVNVVWEGREEAQQFFGAISSDGEPVTVEAFMAHGPVQQMAERLGEDVRAMTALHMYRTLEVARPSLLDADVYERLKADPRDPDQEHAQKCEWTAQVIDKNGDGMISVLEMARFLSLLCPEGNEEQAVAGALGVLQQMPGFDADTAKISTHDFAANLPEVIDTLEGRNAKEPRGYGQPTSPVKRAVFATAKELEALACDPDNEKAAEAAFIDGLRAAEDKGAVLAGVLDKKGEGRLSVPELARFVRTLEGEAMSENQALNAAEDIVKELTGDDEATSVPVEAVVKDVLEHMGDRLTEVDEVPVRLFRYKTAPAAEDVTPERSSGRGEQERCLDPAEREFVEEFKAAVDRNKDGYVSVAELALLYEHVRPKLVGKAQDILDGMRSYLDEGAVIDSRGHVQRVRVAVFATWFFGLLHPGYPVGQGQVRSVAAFRHNAKVMAGLRALQSSDADPDTAAAAAVAAAVAAAKARPLPERATDMKLNVAWVKSDGPWHAVSRSIAVSQEDSLEDVFTRYRRELQPYVEGSDVETRMYLPENQPAWVLVQLGSATREDGYALDGLDHRVSDLSVGGSEDTVHFIAEAVRTHKVFRKAFSRDAATPHPPVPEEWISAWKAWTEQHADEASRLSDPELAKRIYLRVARDLTGCKKGYNVHGLKPEELNGVKEINASREHFQFIFGDTPYYHSKTGSGTINLDAYMK